MNPAPTSSRDAPRPHMLVDQAAAVFTRRYGCAPVCAGYAPGRINIIGDHIDYAGGSVLPMAIDRGTAVVIGRPHSSSDSHSKHRACSAELDVEVTIDARFPDEAGHGMTSALSGPDLRFERFIRGTIELFSSQAGCDIGPCDIAICSTLPMGGGLSSSAALTVALCTALEELGGVELDPFDRARICREVEHSYVGAPCGVMDQFAAIFSRPGCALLINCRSNAMLHVDLSRARDLVWLVVDSGVRHELAEGSYADRRADCRAAGEALGVDSLLDMADLPLQRLTATHLNPVLRDRAQHVLDERDRVLRAVVALQSAPAPDLNELGRLMFDSHDSLRNLYAVSCFELDAIVEESARLTDSGVFGARMTGGGFGGCAILAVHSDCAGEIAEEIGRSSGVHPRGVFQVQPSDKAFGCTLTDR